MFSAIRLLISTNSAGGTVLGYWGVTWTNIIPPSGSANSSA
jgi:hypothetical protein